MSQEENRKDFNASEGGAAAQAENSDQNAPDSSEQTNLEEIDNLPVESIGSYARLDELLTDEEAENANDPTSQS
jgi:hypothetical protein